jgi:hypothetical protein
VPSLARSGSSRVYLALDSPRKGRRPSHGSVGRAPSLARSGSSRGYEALDSVGEGTPDADIARPL